MKIPVRQFIAQLLPLTPQPIYLVGGSVRDLLLGNQDMKDIDLMMPSGSEDVARPFADRIGGSFFFLDEERRITRVVKHEAGETIQFDFTNFEGPDLNTDLNRRDFTMNAMALDLREFAKTGSLDGLVDLFGGREDVRGKRIRVTNPKVLDDDPLRLLRAIRFSATLGFGIETNTADQIRQRAELIAQPSAERLRDEFFQIFSCSGAEKNLLLMDSLGLLQRLVPELDSLAGFAPGQYHQYDVRTHSIKAAGYVDSVLDDLPRICPEYAARVLEHLEEPLEQFVPRKAALRFACLMHDIAKRVTFSQNEEGRIHFYGHENLGADMVKETCRRLRLSRDTENTVVKLIKHHMRLFHLSTPAGMSKRAMYRYCRELGAGLPESLILAQSDARATYDIMPREKFTDTEKSLSVVLEYYYERFLKTEARPLVTGRDLIERGFKPGPKFREILDEIKERQAGGSLGDRREALDYLDTLRG